MRTGTAARMPAVFAEMASGTAASAGSHKHCEGGILAKMGNAKRGAFYQAPDLIAVLEEASSLEGIRRTAAR